MNPQLAELIREMEDVSRGNGGIPGAAREAGQFLNLLVKARGAVNVLEVGTHDGYTTLWLAEAAAATGGAVTTVESDVWRLSVAKAYFDRSPYHDIIRVVQGEVTEVLPVLEGPFDFVLLDADAAQALHYFHILAEKTSSGAFVCCDRAISMAGVLAPYLTYVHERPGLESLLVPIGEGIEMTYKTP